VYNDDTKSTRVFRSELLGVPRLFRLWEKKRGNRRTGSKLVGTVGEALFSATLFLLGCVSLSALIASQSLAPSPRFEPGFGFWVMVLVLGSFVLLGGGGIIWTVFQVGASAERRSALAKKAATIDLTGKVEADRQEKLPCIPSDANLTNSPGVELRYRLPVVQSPAWRLIFAAAFCLIWNTSAAILVVFVVRSFLAERPDWFLTIFTIPFLVIGGCAIYDFARQMLIYTGIGPTNVEISDHPLRRGGKCDVYLSQAGRLWMKTLALSLVCEEAATYQQGTDVRTERRSVFNRLVFRKTDFSIVPGIPFEHKCSIEIPGDAMHSFQSEHNAVNWKLVLLGEADAWPPYERSFPIIIYPHHVGDKDSNGTADRDSVK
jgi:hypothetical protein